jgi:ATP-binding cassette subfamily F protein 3
MLARLMAQRADCLFLDEPTNDLDIPSREALEDVLASYEGALFVVSHDRYLLKRLAERVVAIRDGKASIVDADYETYERRLHEPKRDAAPERDALPAARGNPAGDRKNAHEGKLELGRRKRALADAEQRVADLDRDKAELERLFAVPELYDDPDEIVRLQRQMERVNAESEAALEAWEIAAASLEGFAKTSVVPRG